MRKIILNPQYKSLYTFIETLPQNFNAGRNRPGQTEHDQEIQGEWSGNKRKTLPGSDFH